MNARSICCKKLFKSITKYLQYKISSMGAFQIFKSKEYASGRLQSFYNRIDVCSGQQRWSRFNSHATELYKPILLLKKAAGHGKNNPDKINEKGLVLPCGE
jgi:hypothetical protein